MSACHPGKIAFHKASNFEWQADIAGQSLNVNLTSPENVEMPVIGSDSATSAVFTYCAAAEPLTELSDNDNSR